MVNNGYAPVMIVVSRNLSSHLMANGTLDESATYSMESAGLDNTTSLNLSKLPYPHTIEYKPMLEMIFKTLLYVPIIVLTIIGNTIVIAVVAKNKRMQTTTNYYIVNLAVADCLIALTCSWTHLVDDLTPFWVLGGFFCTFNAFCQVLSLMASVFTLTFIACDRFFGIVYAMKAHFIERRASFTIVLIWLLSIAVASPLIFYRGYQEVQWKDVTESFCMDTWPVNIIHNPETKTSIVDHRARRTYFMFVCVALFFVPCLVMFCAYLVIIVTLWSAQVPGERISKDIKSQTKMRKRVVVMLVIILTVFMICWSPLVGSLIYAEFVHDNLHQFAQWYAPYEFFSKYLAHFNSFINPFIYAGFNNNFKKGFQNLCRGGDTRTRYNTMVSRVDSFQSSTHMTKV
ncbi:QRFP-like peptide receptor isoform X2 [Biomphalaria glabrata]|uniref:QRFP-like peptide receptor isoform X2 n=2 Tax=Biomphalaria glabrata TaxID=6526 RepID=A0A9W2ZPG1_BIOGL|nr:QRFP-like peptide receptor isoform X2 [Biomphalaria glabrata]